MLAYSTLRSPILALHIALICAGAVALLPTVAMAQHGYAQKPVPSGLVAMIKNDPTQPLDLKPFSNPYMSGVGLQIYWSDIEPVSMPII